MGRGWLRDPGMGCAAAARGVGLDGGVMIDERVARGCPGGTRSFVRRENLPQPRASSPLLQALAGSRPAAEPCLARSCVSEARGPAPPAALWRARVQSGGSADAAADLGAEKPAVESFIGRVRFHILVHKSPMWRRRLGCARVCMQGGALSRYGASLRAEHGWAPFPAAPLLGADRMRIGQRTR